MHKYGNGQTLLCWIISYSVSHVKNHIWNVFESIDVYMKSKQPPE